VAEISRLVLSGETIRSIRCGRHLLGPDLVTAVVTLVKRGAIVQQFAASSGLEVRKAEAIFNQVFIQQAVSIQARLQGLSHPSVAASESRELDRVVTGLLAPAAWGETASTPASTASIQPPDEVLKLPLNAATLMTRGPDDGNLPKGRTRA
jgi:hypothetical protein